jgi:hypothetical protein
VRRRILLSQPLEKPDDHHEEPLILVETAGDLPRRTGLVTLNRPKQMNALNDALMDQLGAALLASMRTTASAASSSPAAKRLLRRRRHRRDGQQDFRRGL